MTRHERIVEMLMSGEILIPPYYTKSDEDLYQFGREFEQIALRYIRAVEQRRVICFIQGDSHSEITKHVTFLMCVKNKGFSTYTYHYLNQFIGSAAGIPLNNRNELIVRGYGRVIMLSTHYQVIQRLRQAGFLKKKKAEELARMTPTNAMN